MRFYTLHRTPARSSIGIGRYESNGNWWIRIGTRGPGLRYQNIRKNGYDSLDGERRGDNHTVAIRFGPHLFTILRSASIQFQYDNSSREE